MEKGREVGKNFGRYNIKAIKNKEIFKKEMWLTERLSGITHEKCAFIF